MAGEHASPIARAHLRQSVTARILTGIFQRQFHSGSRLVAQHLCDLYQVSQTPVREALQELEALGIVEVAMNRGAVVRPFGPQQIHEMGQVRRVLEVEATRGACGRILPTELKAVERALVQVQAISSDGERSRAGRAADTRLHTLIRSSCGNDRLAFEIDRYLTLFRALRDVSHERDAWTSSNDMPEQHLAITRALLRSDADEAALAMDRHLRCVTEILTEIVFGGSECSGGTPDLPGPEGPRASPLSQQRVRFP
jgi:DNA-binding GntR family transcriptional regulator